MNAAERLLRKLFRFDGGGARSFDAIADASAHFIDHIHPDIELSLFGAGGDKQRIRGKQAYSAFMARCIAAIAERSDAILSIEGAGEEMAIVRGKAYRKSAQNGEECHYEWVMLYRIEDGLVTYGTDMLDRQAADFWTRVEQA